MKLYRYVGPKEIVDRVRFLPAGIAVRSSNQLRAWVKDTGQELAGGCITVTFVIDTSGQLLIADRRSEHVACAAGQPVRSAGEMTFLIGDSIAVTEVSNQSTGYCPEPESWPTVASALSSAGFEAPNGFSRAYGFRRCKCGNVTLIKHGIFECGVCGADLPIEYNIQ